jgi:hypothetical protein
MIQDLTTPDLKAIDARLTALEKLIEQGFNAAEVLASSRHEALVAQICHVGSECSESAEYGAAARHYRAGAEAVAKKTLEQRFTSAEQLASSRDADIGQRFAAADQLSSSRHEATVSLLDIERRLSLVELAQKQRSSSLTPGHRSAE